MHGDVLMVYRQALQGKTSQMSQEADQAQQLKWCGSCEGAGCFALRPFPCEATTARPS